MTTFSQSPGRRWQVTSGVLLLISIGLFIALIAVVSQNSGSSGGQNQSKVTSDALEAPLCGASDPNGNTIDLSEPITPGPFHDLTKAEMIKLRTFLENDPQIRANSMREPDSMSQINSSYVYMADLWLPPKSEVLKHLDTHGEQPPRRARVMMFRGDKNPPVVEELICGPLPEVAQCTLLRLPNRRNPVEFESRPFSEMETNTVYKMLPQVDAIIGHILKESYDATFTNCESTGCLVLNPSPTASGMTGKLKERREWFWGLYKVPFPLLHPTDLGLQFDLTGSDTSRWSVRKVWYHGQVFDSLEDFKTGYEAGSVIKSEMKRPVYSEDLFSTLHRRHEFSPPNPQRPPTLVEPDGKRYSINGRRAKYLDWSFNFRMSSFSGPQLYDVKFGDDRIAYELSLAEIAAFYSGDSPLSQATDYVDSGALSSLGSKSVVLGGDCPDTATIIDLSVWNQHGSEPGQYDAAFCMFEQNNGYPLRRHSSFKKPGAYYGGMLDSALTLRSILVVGNYDYVIDFIFHQNGALETRLMSTGYIQSNVYREVERLYGVKIEESITGNLHHHIFNIKADLDVGGTSNRYKTYDIKPMDTKLSWDNTRPYAQTQFSTHVRQTEKEALYHHDINHPKYHLIYTEGDKNQWGEDRAYRVHLSGMSKTLLPEGQFNEKAISWARQQMAVTKRKEEEFMSSSNYAMYDTAEPVVDFSTFYADDESIIDEDLVLWLTLGLHHIPHTEDLPVTPTPGNHLTVMFLPNNYFTECPSMGSRDAIFVGYKDKTDPSKGVYVERNGNSRDQCVIPKPSLEEDVEKKPDLVLESKRDRPSF